VRGEQAGEEHISGAVAAGGRLAPASGKRSVWLSGWCGWV
jgi:hypothetical protein